MAVGAGEEKEEEGLAEEWGRLAPLGNRALSANLVEAYGKSLRALREAVDGGGTPPLLDVAERALLTAAAERRLGRERVSVARPAWALLSP